MKTFLPSEMQMGIYLAVIVLFLISNELLSIDKS